MSGLRLAVRLRPAVPLIVAALVRDPRGILAQDQAKSSAQVRAQAYRLDGRPDWALTVGEKPVLTIGRLGTGAEYEFSDIAGVSRLRDGRWAVGNLSTSEIRVYDRNGRFQRAMGRKGRGPGEFPFLWQFWRVADTLIGVDGAGLGQVFAVDGTFLRSIPRPSAAGRPVERFGFLGDGSYIGGYLEPSEPGPSEPATRWMTLVRSRGDSTAFLQRYKARQMARKGKGEPIPLVYGPRIETAVLGLHYCAGYSEAFAFDCYASDGHHVVSVRMMGQRPPEVTAHDRQVYFDGVDKGNPGPRAAKYREEVRAVTVFADRLPAYGRFVASTSEELWVGPLVPADATVGTFNPSPATRTTWYVFSMEGKWVGRVDLPSRFRLMEAGADYVAGISRDSDDVEQVVVYTLSRSH